MLITHQFRMRLNQGYGSSAMAILSVKSGTNRVKDDLAPNSL